MKRFIFAALLLSLTFAVQAQRLGAINQTLDLGQVTFNRPVTAEFEMINKSDRDVRIVQARSSCGCTTVDYPQRLISRDEKFMVSVTYDARMLGHFHKSVSLYVDGDDAPVMLVLKGVVVDKVVNYAGDYAYQLGELKADKNNIEFDDVNSGDMPTARIHILNPTDKVAQPTVMHLPDYLKAEVSPSKLAPGQGGVVTFSLDSHALHDYGLTQTNVYLGMNPGERVASNKGIGISAVLLPSFSNLTELDIAQSPKLHLSTTTLDLGAFGNKKKLKGDIFIINEGNTPLEINNLQMFTEGIQLSLGKRRLEPGEITTLKVTAVAKDLRQARSKPRVLMITNDPKRPKETIEIHVE